MRSCPPREPESTCRGGSPGKDHGQLSCGLGIRFRPMAVGDDPDRLQGYQTLRDHGVKLRQKSVHAVLPVHDLDDYREILGKAQHLGCVDPAVRAEPEEAPQNRGTGHAAFASFIYNDLHEGLLSTQVRPFR